ncbi:hypothetical protein [Metabacillus niabensis]|uniref:Holin n=1 Tax=Metabacillus niabensis TaxID=324854 RepID=A0ABT9Z1J3_9BACI|nr:hypothetical protein [Metabacillus niabensis]MDQ0225741.1 hypothetical protein [Metabacillus niabensis]
MDFPTIHTNFWDAVIAVPIVMLITQLIKVFLKVKRKYVPTIALILGLSISIFISHRHDLLAGVFMGWFYGYAAIGSYASLKTTLISFRSEKENNIRGS